MGNLSDNLGQLLIIGFDGTSVEDGVKSLLARFRPAGVILFARNLVAPEQTRKLTEDLQSFADELGIGPLLIGIDHEGGKVVRMGPPLTRFPGNLALARTGSLDLARRQARAMAEELLAMGVNWNFAPCVDVNSNPRNPIIGERAFGDNPEKVSAFGAAMIEEFQQRGLIACAKHFPGHGDTAVDSHLGLPCVSRPLESLREIELPPFRGAIAAGVASIMTAHIVFPALDAARPATASARIIGGLLREELGFEGVVVSDALEMAGFANSIGLKEGAPACINAGVDLLMVCNGRQAQEEVLSALQEASAAGRLDTEMIERAQGRVDSMKKAFLRDRAATPLARVGCEEHRALEAEIAGAGRL